MSRCGYVSIIGPPNVGKSSLMNRILGESLSIVCSKPQTTRNNINGILTVEKKDAQIIFVDTPGLHDSGKLLNQSLNMSAQEALLDSDLCLVLESSDTRPDNAVAECTEFLEKRNIPHIRIRTKCDMFKYERADGKDIFNVSSEKGTGVKRLLDRIIDHMPEGPYLYDPEYYTDLSLRFLSSEMIRLYVFEYLEQELPYSSAVEIEEYKEERDPVLIRATILVEKDSQKPMVIGQGGRMIKKIGTEARKEIERMTGRKVFLDLRVKVLKNWTRKKPLLKRLGYKTC